MSKKFISMFLALLLVVVLVVVVACGKKEEGTGTQTGNTTEKPVPTKTLKVGLIMPMSGPASLWGIGIKKDTDAYAEVINDDGGLKIGDEYYKVEVYYADDEATPDNAARATNELINNNGVSAILGYWGIGLPTIASIATPQKVVTVTVTPANYDPQTMPYVAFPWTGVYSGLVQLDSVLNAWPETKTLGISADNIYYSANQVIMPMIKERLQEKGITYFEDTYEITATEFANHIDKLRKAKVDSIFSFSTPQAEALKQKEIFAEGYKVNFAGAGTLADLKSYIDISGYDAAQGGLHPHNYPWDLSMNQISPDVVTLSERIRDKHQEMLDEEMNYDGAFPFGLNTMIMYFEALQKAGTTDADEVMKVIDGGTFDLFTGTYTLSGKETYGRAVFGPATGPMGKVVDYKTEFVSEAPAYVIP